MDEGCECWPTPPSMWTTYGSAVEPASAIEWNPDCPVHPIIEPAEQQWPSMTTSRPTSELLATSATTDVAASVADSSTSPASTTSSSGARAASMSSATSSPLDGRPVTIVTGVSLTVAPASGDPSSPRSSSTTDSTPSSSDAGTSNPFDAALGRALTEIKRAQCICDDCLSLPGLGDWTCPVHGRFLTREYERAVGIPSGWFVAERDEQRQLLRIDQVVMPYLQKMEFSPAASLSVERFKASLNRRPF